MNNPKIEIEYHAPSGLKPNPWNSNKVGPEMEVRLEASIREFGFIRPILCRELDDGSLEILGGEHRTRKAAELGIESVPVVVLKNVDDKRAKAMGLADNGRYGQDDALKLSEILKDIGDEFVGMLAFSEQDLAGIFASSSVNLDDLGFDDDADSSELTPADAPRSTITHQVMRFKVPVEDAERVEKFIQNIVKTRGFSSEQDSMVQVGMALVEIINAAKETM
jgi:ParB-like chromosome segregation protein Spo0J